MQILQKKTEVGSEKKVEYLELIYDLIFVYIIGRNNQLLQYIENGFIRSATFYSYILCALAIIQIWNFSTFYINMFGRNSLRDHLSLFVNMYLLYYIGEGTRVHWESFQNQYHTAWALILINIGVQYCIEYRHHLDNEDEKKTIRHKCRPSLMPDDAMRFTLFPCRMVHFRSDAVSLRSASASLAG